MYEIVTDNMHLHVAIQYSLKLQYMIHSLTDFVFMEYEFIDYYLFI